MKRKMCVVQRNVMKRVRNGRRKWPPSLLQKGERERSKASAASIYCDLSFPEKETLS